jgi:hypothetical protein
MVNIRTPIEHGFQVKTACTKGPFAYFKHPTYVAMLGCSLSTVLTFNSACKRCNTFLIRMSYCCPLRMFFSIPKCLRCTLCRVLGLAFAACGVSFWHPWTARGEIHERLFPPRLHRVHQTVSVSIRPPLSQCFPASLLLLLLPFPSVSFVHGPLVVLHCCVPSPRAFNFYSAPFAPAQNPAKPLPHRFLARFSHMDTQGGASAPLPHGHTLLTWTHNSPTNPLPTLPPLPNRPAAVL